MNNLTDREQQPLPQSPQLPAQPSVQQPIQPMNYQQVSDILAQEAGAAQEVLFEAQTVFPFVLFPDKVIIDRVKVTIMRSSFFKHADTVSFRIEDILDASASIGPFFGMVNIRTRFFNEKTITVKYLSRRDAQRVKNVLQGYVITRQQRLDTHIMPKDQLVPLLDRLGQDIATAH